MINYMTIPGMKPLHRKSLMRLKKQVIIDTICEQYETTSDLMASEDRKRESTYPRHLIMYFLFNYAGMDKSHIGRLLNRDHTTVLSGIKTIEKLMATDSLVKDDVEELRRQIFINDNDHETIRSKTVGNFRL